MDYVVVGTDHKLQKSDSADKGVQTLLRSILANKNIVLIAEEADASKDVMTFGRQLIGESKWLSIDMTEQERKDAGIYNALLGGPPARSMTKIAALSASMPFIKTLKASGKHFGSEKATVGAKVHRSQPELL